MPEAEPNPEKKMIPRNRPYLVSFSGIDGAGKTTQIDALFTWLRDAGLKVRLLRFWDDIAVAGTVRETLSHKLFNSERGVGSPDRPVNRRDKNVRGWYMTAARLVLYLVDAIHLSFVIATTSRTDAEVVIFDRYLHDQLVNLDMGNPVVGLYAHLLGRLVPKPDIAFLLDADPAQARARKPEYPLEFLVRSRACYLELAKSTGMTVLKPLAADDITRIMLREIPRASLRKAAEVPPAAAFRRSHQ